MGPRASEGQAVDPAPTRLSFRFRDGLGDRELPVEIRRADFALVARSRSREQVALDPGNYIVLGRFPDGLELRGEIAIEPGQEHAEVELGPALESSRVAYEPDPEPDTASGDCFGQLIGRMSGGSRLTLRLRGERFGDRERPDGLPEGTRLEILWVGWPQGVPVKSSGFDPEIDQTGTFRVPAPSSLETFGMRLLRLERTGPVAADKLVVLWPLPDAATGSARFRVVETPTGLEVHLANEQAELALGYLRRGALSEAASAVASGLLSVREMRARRRWDPLAAALGAYLLHRDRNLSQEAEEWVGGLDQDSPTLPDTYCLRAEILARRQNHTGAFKALMGLAVFGLPFFSEGLTLACGRLASYLRSERFLQSIDEISRAGALLLFTRLNWLGAHRIIGEPVLSLKGFDPRDPEDLAEFRALSSPGSRGA